MNCEEAQELITALIDGELLDPDRVPLESHLKECPRCQLGAARERLLKQTIRGRAEQMRAPFGLRARIISDRRIFANKKPARWREYIWPMPRLASPALAAGLLLAIALPGYFLLKPTSEPIATAALETYDRFARGELSVNRAETPDEIVERLTQAVGGRFRPMGYDLSAMDLRPVAGMVREIKGRRILVTVYQGPGAILFCYTFPGSEEDAPPNSAKFVDAVKEITFYAFSRGGVNAVFHREGEIICILASEMPMDKLLALAQAKAKPS